MSAQSKPIVWDDPSINRLKNRVFEGSIPNKRSDLGPCWENTYSPSGKQGYKKVRDASGRKVYVHRFMWCVHNNQQAPSHLVVNHLCENPGCCNPAHLDLDTRRGNTVYSDKCADFRSFPCQCLRGHECLSIDDLYSHQDGTVQCKQCMKENHSRLDKERLREYNRQYRLANLEKIRAREREYDKNIRERG